MVDTVPVLDDPQEPEDARVDDSLLLWVGPLVALLFGLILTLGSSGALAAAMISEREAKRAAAPPIE